MSTRIPTHDDADLQPEHPLERLTSGGWMRGLLRLGVAVVLVAVILAMTGERTLELLLRLEHLPYLATGAALTLAQRAVRVRKWALILEPTRLRQSGWLHLLRVQLIGLLTNLALPVSEGLKLWAVCHRKGDIALGTRSLMFDIGLTSVAVGGMGLIGAALVPGLPVWVPLAVLALTVVATGAAVVLRGKPRQAPDEALPMRPLYLGLSAIEAALILATFALALAAIGVHVTPLLLLALFPLLYLSHLFMLTPSGLGLREAIFALVFGALSETPTEVAVAMGLMVSAMQLIVALGAGGLALLWPSRQPS